MRSLPITPYCGESYGRYGLKSGGASWCISTAVRHPELITRALAIAGCAWALGPGGSVPAAERPVGPSAPLQEELAALARQARPGTLGVTVTDLRSGRTWRINADRSYPMMSVFKAPLGATVLSEVDQGRISLDRTVDIRRKDLMMEGVSEIAASFRGDRETFTVRQLLAAAVSHSDNTAADVLLKIAGGPRNVTAFLRAHGLRHMRVDRGEQEIAGEFQQRNARHAPTAPETAAQRAARLRRGYQAYLRDPRDRTTPDDAAIFLRKLWRGELLSPGSTRRLLSLLYAQTVPDRLRAGIPADVRLADKCGTSYSVDGRTAAFNDMGILTWPDGHTVIVAAFLTASRAPEARMNAIFGSIARAVVADLRAVPPAAP
jgi:beta-lactamase class A